MLRSDKKVLAVDIGSQRIKALVVSQSGDTYQVLKAGNIELPRTNDQGWDDHPADEIEGALNLLFKRQGIKAGSYKQVISSLTGNAYSLKQIETQDLKGEELDSSLNFEARKHLPAGGDIIMDYQVLGRSDSKLNVLLAVARKEAVKDHLEILRKTGLKESLVDLPPIGLINLSKFSSRIKNLPPLKESCRLLINLGSKFTQLCFCSDSKPLFVRELPIGGQNFTREQALKSGLSVAEAEKEKLKILVDENVSNRKGNTDGDNAPSLTLESDSRTVMDGLLSEIQRSIRFYAKESGIRNIEQCIITGGSSQSDEIKHSLNKFFSGKTIQLNPFESLKLSGDCDRENPYQYSICLGMAVRRLDELSEN